MLEHEHVAEADGFQLAGSVGQLYSALSALSVSVVCGLNDEWLLLLLRRSRWMMRQSWEMRMMMMVMTMKSGLSKNLEGDRNEVVEFESAVSGVSEVT